MVPLQVLFAFGVAVMVTRAQARRRLVPHDLLPARADPAGRGDARRSSTSSTRPPGRSTRCSPSIGIDGPLWFNDPAWAKPSLVLLALWGIGNTMIIFLAALLDVPRHLHESAELDGAGARAAPALGDAADDQPRDPVLRRARRDPGAAVLPAGLRRRDRRRRLASQAGTRATWSSATPKAPRSSTPCSSTTTASASSTWATPRRWRCCCSRSRSWPRS